MSFTVQQEKTTLAGHQQKARGLTNRLEVIHQLERDVTALVDIVREAEDSRVELEGQRRKKSGQESQLHQKRIELETAVDKSAVRFFFLVLRLAQALGLRRSGDH
jgi:hypothetical protein